MQTELYVNNKLLELDDDVSVRLNKVLYDPVELTAKDITFSINFNIPSTQHNNEIFGYKNIEEVPNKFGELYNAQLYVNGILIINGLFSINNITNDYYSGNIYNPNQKSLKDIFGDKSINQIAPHYIYASKWEDIDRLNKNLLPEKINTNVDKHICFPYVLYNLPYNNAEFVDGENNINGSEIIFDKYTQSNINSINGFKTDSNIVNKYVYKTWSREIPNEYKPAYYVNSTSKIPSTYQVGYNSVVVSEWTQLGSQSPKIKYNIYTWQQTSGSITTEPTVINKGGSWNLDTLLPAFNVQSVVKDIFKTYNYNVQGTFFTDPRFNNLYHSYMGSHEDYLENRDNPYYIELTGSYSTRKNNNNSSTLKQINGLDDIRFFQDDILNSENNTIQYKVDDFDMKLENSSILIPKSGWYRVGCGVNFSTDSGKNNRWTQDGRYPVCSTYSSRDNVGLSRRFSEFHITLSDSPASSSIKPVSIFGFNPSSPDVISNDVVSDNGFNVRYNQGAKLAYNAYYDALEIRDIEDTRNFIAGARWGQFYFGSGGGNGDINKKMGMLYNSPISSAPQNNNMDYWNFAKDSNGRPQLQSTNVALIKQNGVNNKVFYNLKGVCEYNIINNDDTYTKTIEVRNNSRVAWNGLSYSTAKRLSNTSGNANIDEVIWLEKGQYISMNITTPLVAYGRESCSFWRCKTKDKSDCAVQATLDYTLQLAYITNNSNWTPKDGIDSWNILANNRATNVNSYLPKDIKINDYFNSLIETFNLKVSRINSNLYSIDTNNTNDDDAIGEILNIEPYTDIRRNQYSKIDLPNEYQFNFTIDQDEWGYEYGFNYNTGDWDGEYDGSKLIINPTSTNGSVIKRESIFSYTWFKDIFWKDGRIDGQKVFSDIGYVSTPIITTKDIWDNTYNYATAQDEGIMSDLTFRFFWVNSYLNFDIFPLTINPTSTNGKVQMSICNETSNDGTLRIDFNNGKVNLQNDILSNFFNIKLVNGHKTIVSLYLPNEYYKKIKNNTRFKMNNDIYKIMEVQSFDPLEINETKLTLLKE